MAIILLAFPVCSEREAVEGSALGNVTEKRSLRPTLRTSSKRFFETPE